MHNVALIRGDGVGPSIMGVRVKVVEASGVDIYWHGASAGMAAFEQFQNPLPDATLESIKK